MRGESIRLSEQIFQVVLGEGVTKGVPYVAGLILSVDEG